jgi:hypothetical protein
MVFLPHEISSYCDRTAVIDDPATIITPHGHPDLREVLERVFETARSDRYEGYSKHDALNAPWLERVAGGSRPRRLIATQVITRSPFDLRPWAGVRKARNPKGISLFARALLSRYRMTGSPADSAEARDLLDWLVAHPSPGFPWPCWGYPYPWQDVGFFAPRHFPNRVVTSFVGQALLDGYETLQDERYLVAAGQAVRFLLEAPRTLFEDEQRRCVSYVPDESVDWIVMDVSALTGALAARLAHLVGDPALLVEAGRLVRYVVSKQTGYGAWYYADPPTASHITHDNYHTGFILDAVLQYGLAADSSEFADAYQRGIDFYARRLFEADGAARFMSDRHYPIDIHGCAQGVITFSLQRRHLGAGADMARRILGWTLAHMWDPASGWFYYQQRRGFRTSIRELRWCQGWMACALASYMESCGAPG